MDAADFVASGGRLDPNDSVPFFDDNESGARKNQLNRPVIVVSKGDGHEAVNSAIDAIAADDRFFQRGADLVTVATWSEDDARRERRLDRPVGAPVIVAVSKPTLWCRLSQLVRWEKYDGRSKQLEQCDPPDRVVAAVHEAPEWPGVRPLIGTTSTPIVHEDGSVRVDFGYDDKTGLYYVSPPMPIVVGSTRADAQRARQALEEILVDFPIVGDSGRSGWLSALLTPIVRHLCPCVPMHVFDSSTPSSGKSLLAELVALIVGGQPMARGPCPETSEEMRKRIMSHALAGDQLVSIDNVPGGWVVGWAALDMALTAPTITDRILGASKSATLRNVMNWYVTGNNIVVRGDTARRALVVRLSPGVEHPELRDPSTFRFPRLPQHVVEHRAELLGAGLTIVASYLCAGRPDVGVKPVGSFEGWSEIVASAIVWAGGADPCELFASRRLDADPAVTTHVQLLEALARYPDGLTSKGILDHCVETFPGHVDDPDLREVIAALSSDGKLPTVRKLGYLLREHLDRVRRLSDGTDARLVAERNASNVAYWRVETIY